MNLQLYSKESVRIHVHDEPFIDVRHIGYESIAIDLYSFQGYIEIRKKEGYFRVYQFPKKSYKKEHDFGFWEDAEVIYSFNENGKDKGVR